MFRPYHVDRFENKVDTNISLISKDIKEKLKIFYVG